MRFMKSNLKVHFSSQKQDWETPQDFFNEVDQEFDFVWDLAATQSNTKVAGCYYDEHDNSLSQVWHTTASGWLWLNPPYGRELSKWVEKCSEEHQKGANIVLLVPARTDTKYFHKYIYNQPNVEIRFIKGRLKFGGADNSAPFPSMLVIFRSV